jgi:hypothetical protein
MIRLALQMALDYTKKQSAGALRAALKELATESTADVLRFLSCFSPEILEEAKRRSQEHQ